MAEYIDRQAALNALSIYGDKQTLDEVYERLVKLPAADQEEIYLQGWEDGRKNLLEPLLKALPKIVYCKDCIYRTTFGTAEVKGCEVNGDHIGCSDYDFCSNGRRKNEQTG